MTNPSWLQVVPPSARWLLLAATWCALAAGARWLTSPWHRPAVASNLERWNSMAPDQQRLLVERFERFKRLPRDRQQALKQLNDYLLAGPPHLRARRLRIAHTYATWKKSLPLDLRRQLDAATPARFASVLEKVVAEWRFRERQRPYWFTLFGPGGAPSALDLPPHVLARLDEELPLQRMFSLGARFRPPRPGTFPPGPRFPLDRLSPEERQEAIRLLEQLRELFDRSRDRQR